MDRASGILLHVSSLPSQGGIGDLGPCARDFADRLAESGQRFWQVLPLNPSNPENGESPYFSSSAFAGNPLLISLELLEGADLVDDGHSPEASAMVDFDAVRAYKSPVLRKVLATGPGPDFEGFCRRESCWLDDYALFTVLKQKSGNRSWNEWPDDLRRRDHAALRRVEKELAAAIIHEKRIQHVFFSQWNSLRAYCKTRGIQIIGDLPIYVSYESADVWAHPHLFQLGRDLKPTMVSGVPPDYFSATGQLWNNPVYAWDTMRADGFAWWVSRMKASFERFDVVRIDHFRGLVKYWAVPFGETTAINGAWYDVPTYDFFDTLLRNMPDFPVIAEDLGLITDDVRDVLRRYGFPGMKVLQFAFGDGDPGNPYLPHNYEKNAVVYTGTHDNLPLRAWIEGGASVAERENLFRYQGRVLSIEESVMALIRGCCESEADLSVVPVQDWLCLGASARMNDPSTPFGNWRWRCTQEQMEQMPFETIKTLTEKFHRFVTIAP